MIIDAASLATLGGGIALAGGLAGSSFGIGLSACAGAATLGQDRRQLRNVVVLAALPLSRAFYAFIFMILIQTSVVPAVVAEGAAPGSGLAVAAIGLIAGSAFGISGTFQGGVCASGICFLAKTRGRLLTNAIMLAVFVELLAVLGLVFCIMALSMLGLM